MSCGRGLQLRLSGYPPACGPGDAQGHNVTALGTADIWSENALTASAAQEVDRAERVGKDCNPLVNGDLFESKMNATEFGSH